MAWARRTRIILLVALLLLAATLSWLASHPSLYAGQVGHLLTTNLLHQAGATFSCRDLEGNPLSRMVFREVTVTREGDDGSFLYLTADSLVVGYDVRDVFSRRSQLREFIAGGVEVLLRQGAGAVPGEHEGGVGSFPTDLRVDHLGLLDIEVRVTRHDGEVVQEFQGINVEFAAETAGDGVDALLTRCEAEWVNQQVRLVQARGRVRLEHPRYEFKSMHVQLDSTRAAVDALVIADGGIDSLWVEGSAETFLLDELMRAIGKGGDGPRLMASGDATVTRSGDVLRIEARGAGHLDDAPVEGREFVGVLVDDVLRFERIDGRYRSADGVVTGMVDLKADPPLLLIEGMVQGIDASDPWAAGQDLGWPASDLAGWARLRLALGDSVRLDLDLEDLHGVAITLPVAQGRVSSTWSEAEGFVLRDARLVSMGARLQADGAISPENEVEFRVGALVDSLAPWAREVLLPVAGEGANVAGILSGTLDSLVLDASGEVEVARALGVEVEDAQIEIGIPRLLTSPGDVDLEIAAPSHSILGRANGELLVRMQRREPLIEVRELVVAREGGRLKARGRVRELADERFAIELDTLGTDWGGDRWRLVEGSRMEVADGYFHTPGLVFESEVGRVAVEGSVRPGAVFDLDLDVRGGDLDLLDRLDLVDGLGGGLDGHIELEGPLDAIGFAVDARVDSLVLPGRVVDSARILARGSGGHVQLDEFELVTARGGLSADGELELDRPDWLRHAAGGVDPARDVWRGAVLDLDVRPRALDVAYWADPALAAGHHGFLTADLRVSGSTAHPTARGSFELRDYPAEPFRFPLLAGDVELDTTGVSLTRGRLDLGGPQATVQARLPVRVSFDEPARFLEGQGVRVEVHTPDEVDLAGLDALWPDLRRTAGQASFHFVASGDPEAPDLQGTLTIRDGVVQLRGWSEWLRELEVDGNFDGRKLALERIEAREGEKGRIHATGVVEFEGLLPDDVALDIRASRVLLSSVPGLKAIASGDDLRLRLERPAPGRPRVPTITGSLLVDKAVYTGSFASDPASEAALGPTAAPPWMARLRIRMQDQVRISNPITELRVAGDVDFVRDTQGARIRGDVEIPSGRISIVGTHFRITEGELDFSRHRLEPEVNLAAVTEIPVYDTVGGTGRSLEEITLNMTGTFAAPELKFESKSGYDDTSILRLIAGFQPTETTGANAAGTLGMRAGFNVLERALTQEMTGVDTVEIETNETTGADDLGSTRIAFGKYLTESVYLRYAQGLTAGERDILLEYQMSRRTLISGEIKSRIDQTGTEDEFNLDFKWRFRY